MDHDGDGLNDTLETTGILTGFGKLYTNPNNPDTDGDGLPDGMEVGELIVDPGTGIQYFKALSDPTKANSDGDGISDYDEYELGTNPLLDDTDHDGINDNVDASPLSYDNNKKPGLSDLEIGRAIVLGAVFGQSGLEGGVFEGYVDDDIASSPYYLLGWIGFGLIPAAGAIADARDAVQSFINGDELGAALNAAGAFSGVGDGVKTIFAVGLFVRKTGKAAEVAEVLAKYVLKEVPNTAVVRQVLDEVFEGAATRLVEKYGDNILQDLIVIAENNGDLRKTIGVAKSGNEIRWLEEGTSTWGWTHIKRPDRWQQIMDKFGSKTEEEVQNMIFDTIESSDQIIAVPGDQYKYVKNFPTVDGSMYQFSVIVSDRAQGIGKGNVITAHPGV